MNNLIQNGEVLTLAVSSGVVSGDPVVVGAINGVALIDRDSAGQATVQTSGVFDLSVAAVNDAGNTTIAIGDRIYYVSGDTPKLSRKATAGTLFGIALEANASSGTTATINVALVAQTEADTGIASAHLADVSQTQDALVDNGGGTADGTVSSQAAPTTLTDSTGYSGTHDDTIEAVAALTTLTDNSGGSGTHDDTIAASTVPTTLTDNTGGSGTHDDTLAAVTAAAGTLGGTADGTLETVGSTSGGDVSGAIMNNFQDLLAAVVALKQNQSDVGQKVIEHNTLLGVMVQNDSDMAQKIMELVTRDAVHAQNVSDVAQKAIELVALAGTAQNNLKEVTTELALVKTDVANLVTKVNAILLALEKFQVLASS